MHSAQKFARYLKRTNAADGGASLRRSSNGLPRRSLWGRRPFGDFLGEGEMPRQVGVEVVVGLTVVFFWCRVLFLEVGIKRLWN